MAILHSTGTVHHYECYGPCADGQFYVYDGATRLPTPYRSLSAARKVRNQLRREQQTAMIDEVVRVRMAYRLAHGEAV